MDKQIWCSDTMKFYLSIKGNEVLTRATTWMNITLSERSQLQNITYCKISLIYMKCPELANL